MAGISKAKGRRHNNKRLKDRYASHPPKAAKKAAARLQAYIDNEGVEPSVNAAQQHREKVYARDKGVDLEVDARRERYLKLHSNPRKNPKGVELAKARLDKVKSTGRTKK